MVPLQLIKLPPPLRGRNHFLFPPLISGEGVGRGKLLSPSPLPPPIKGGGTIYFLSSLPHFRGGRREGKTFITLPLAPSRSGRGS